MSKAQINSKTTLKGRTLFCFRFVLFISFIFFSKVALVLFTNLFLISDIEKRKSFADMKLADVTSSQAGGLPVWSFESRDIPSTIEEGASGDSEFVTEDNNTESSIEAVKGNICNGIKSSTNPVESTNKNGNPVNSNGCNFLENSPASPNTAPSTLANSSGAELQASPAASLASGGTAGSQDTRRPDPVFEISLDLQVKIADLGNACWVVSTYFGTSMVS